MQIKSCLPFSNSNPQFKPIDIIMSAIARNRMKNWEIIADNLSEAGWSWGCVSAVDSQGRTIWIADAHRGGSECKAVFQSARLRHVESERQMMACENDDPPLRHGLVNRTLPVVAV
jgi:hypothetical protein